MHNRVDAKQPLQLERLGQHRSDAGELLDDGGSQRSRPHRPAIAKLRCAGPAEPDKLSRDAKQHRLAAGSHIGGGVGRAVDVLLQVGFTAQAVTLAMPLAKMRAAGGGKRFTKPRPGATASAGSVAIAG